MVVPATSYMKCQCQKYSTLPQISGPRSSIWVWSFPSSAYHWHWSYKW